MLTGYEHGVPVGDLWVYLIAPGCWHVVTPDGHCGAVREVEGRAEPVGAAWAVRAVVLAELSASAPAGTGHGVGSLTA